MVIPSHEYVKQIFNIITDFLRGRFAGAAAQYGDVLPQGRRLCAGALT
jgi:hypothetical protein